MIGQVSRRSVHAMLSSFTHSLAQGPGVLELPIGKYWKGVRRDVLHTRGTDMYSWSYFSNLQAALHRLSCSGAPTFCFEAGFNQKQPRMDSISLSGHEKCPCNGQDSRLMSWEETEQNSSLSSVKTFSREVCVFCFCCKMTVSVLQKNAHLFCPKFITTED